MDQSKSKRIQEWAKDMNETPSMDSSSSSQKVSDGVASIKTAVDSSWLARTQDLSHPLSYLDKLKPLIDTVGSYSPKDLAAMLVRSAFETAWGSSDSAQLRKGSLREALQFMLEATSVVCIATGPAVSWDHSFLQEAVAILQGQFCEARCSLLASLISAYIARGILDANRVFSILLSSPKADLKAVVICERILDLAARAYMGRSVELLDIYEAKLLHRDIGAEAVLRLWLIKAQDNEHLKEFFETCVRVNPVVRFALLREAGSLCVVAGRIDKSLKAGDKRADLKVSVLASTAQLLLSILQSEVATTPPTMKAAFEVLYASAAEEATNATHGDTVELCLAMVEIVIASEQQGSKTADTALAMLAHHPRAAAMAGMAVIRAGGDAAVQSVLTKDLKWMLDAQHAPKRSCHQHLLRYAQRYEEITWALGAYWVCVCVCFESNSCLCSSFSESSKTRQPRRLTLMPISTLYFTSGVSWSLFSHCVAALPVTLSFSWPTRLHYKSAASPMR